MGPEARLDAFTRNRPLLWSIAYRMLGSWADAEDVVQEAFVRWQRTTDQEIASPRSFLVTAVSRLCINQLQSARARREEYTGQWLPEPVPTGDTGDPDAALRVDESLSTAFLVLLEKLTPAERAVFLLREVFEYDYDEIADIIGQTATNCRQILRRARQHVADCRPRFISSPEERSGLAQRFVEASRHGDMRGLLALLSEDVVFYSDGGGKAAAVPHPVGGADAVARLLVNAQRKFVPTGVEIRIFPLNGQPGVIAYFAGRPTSAVTFGVADGRIAAIYLVTNPEKLRALPLLAGDAS